MTAIRNFPDAPLHQRTLAPIRWRMPALAIDTWHALERFGQERAASELDKLANRHARGNPTLARQLRSVGAACRRAADRAHAPAHGHSERTTS
jgi:hypothetical protein